MSPQSRHERFPRYATVQAWHGRGTRRMALALAIFASVAACDPAPTSTSPETTTEVSAPTDSTSPASPAGDEGPSTLLVWQPGGMTGSTVRDIALGPGSRMATDVTAGLQWLDGASEGRVPPAGLAFPFEIAYLGSPKTYATLIEGAENLGLNHLRRGELFLAETAAKIRGVGQGARLSLDGRRWIVAKVVPDYVTSGYEALAPGPPPPGWGDRYILLLSGGRDALQRSVRKTLGRGEPFRIRAEGETPFLRYADAVSPQMYFKERFGEFAARVVSGGRIEVDRRWNRRNIVKARLPLIGKLTCHRDFIPQVRGALKAIVESGLDRFIKPEEFAGCYSSRFISWDPSGRLSSHAWGAAVDINAASNPLGSEPTIDRRLVQRFERAELNWGGRWLVPDGMHFEWKAPNGS